MTESLSEIMSKPTYQASLRLAAGTTVRVTMLADEKILFDVRDDNGCLRAAEPTPGEAAEIASMLNAAQRVTWRGRA